MPKKAKNPEVVDLSTTPRTALIRLPDVLRIFPVGRSTFLRGVQAGIYPKPVPLGKRAVGWSHGEIIDLAAGGVAL